MTLGRLLGPGLDRRSESDESHHVFSGTFILSQILGCQESSSTRRSWIHSFVVSQLPLEVWYDHARLHLVVQ